MGKIINLIHDNSENKHSYYGFEFTDISNNQYNDILERSLSNLSDSNLDRKLKILTWGKLLHKEPNCDITFDLSKFSTKLYDNSKKLDLKLLDGRDEIIQISIIQHPIFDLLIEKILNEINENNADTISFVCNHGKHRSVGWAEILKKYYFKNASVHHYRFKENQKEV